VLLLKTSTPNSNSSNNNVTVPLPFSFSNKIDTNKLESAGEAPPKANNNNNKINNKITTLPLRGAKAAHPKREKQRVERERERGGLWVGPEITNCGNNNDRES
jgi:hypothetical protein